VAALCPGLRKLELAVPGLHPSFFQPIAAHLHLEAVHVRHYSRDIAGALHHLTHEGSLCRESLREVCIFSGFRGCVSALASCRNLRRLELGMVRGDQGCTLLGLDQVLTSCTMLHELRVKELKLPPGVALGSPSLRHISIASVAPGSHQGVNLLHLPALRSVDVQSLELVGSIDMVREMVDNVMKWPVLACGDGPGCGCLRVSSDVLSSDVDARLLLVDVAVEDVELSRHTLCALAPLRGSSLARSVTQRLTLDGLLIPSEAMAVVASVFVHAGELFFGPECSASSYDCVPWVLLLSLA